MPAYIMFIREKTLDESRIEAYRSKAPPTRDGRPIKLLASHRGRVTLDRVEVECVVVAEFPSLEVARAWYENPKRPAAAEHRLDSWLADMEYCDRF